MGVIIYDIIKNNLNSEFIFFWLRWPDFPLEESTVIVNHDDRPLQLRLVLDIWLKKAN